MINTLKQCIEAAKELEIPIIGDITYRGDCKKEDTELIEFFTKVKYKYPKYADLIFHCETEFNPTSNTSYAYHARSKAKGRPDRIADIICLPVSIGAPAFLCELKRTNIAKSLASKDSKKRFIEQITRLSSQKQTGAVVCVALGCKNALMAFDEYVKNHEL